MKGLSAWSRSGCLGRFWVRLLPSILLLAAVAAPPAPALAEDGSLVPGGFVVFAAGDRAKRNIMVVDPAGGMPKVLADTPGVMDTQPAVGPSGQLAWIRQNGTDWDLIENGRVLGSGAMYLSPAYMPDGTLTAAISGEEETSIYAIYSSGEKKLLASGGASGLAVSPAFSPDGRRMAYVSNQSNFAQIYITDLGGGGGSRALTSGPARSTDPDWSPKGEQIVFVLAEKDICLVNADGRNLKKLTSNQGLNRDPAFSPDGGQIVFTSDRDGYWRLYVMDLDGGGQRPLLPALAVNQTLPFWSAVPPKKILDR